MYWLYSVLVCAVSQYLGDMDTEGGPSVQEDETTPLLPLLYIPAPPGTVPGRDPTNAHLQPSREYTTTEEEEELIIVSEGVFNYCMFHYYQLYTLLH